MSHARIPELDAPPLVRYGWPDLVYGDSPAAGAMYTFPITGRFLQRPISIFVRLVTDANVASRTVAIEFRDDAARRFNLCGAPVTQSASSTNDWVFSVWQEQAEWSVDSSIIVPLASVLLVPTYDFRIYVSNIQAGDQLSLIRIQRERFFSDAPK
jgi:hypothetical protein